MDEPQAPQFSAAALVTGASRGIGRAVALELASRGASVAALGRETSALESLSGLAEALPGEILGYPGDVRSSDDARSATSWARRQLGRIDLLVHCAGVYTSNPVDKVNDEEWDTTLDTNLRGLFNVCRFVVPLMRRQRSGHIIAIGSVASLRGWAETTAYTASKFGVLGFMDALDEELRAFAVRTTTICPGPTMTRMTESWDLSPGVRSQLLRPEDVASAVVWAATQPQHVAVGLVVLRPLVAPPYSGFLNEN
jgi:3-oxoacyl-[acyl-carrier protein] reductase